MSSSESDSGSDSDGLDDADAHRETQKKKRALAAAVAEEVKRRKVLHQKLGTMQARGDKAEVKAILEELELLDGKLSFISQYLAGATGFITQSAFKSSAWKEATGADHTRMCRLFAANLVPGLETWKADANSFPQKSKSEYDKLKCTAWLPEYNELGRGGKAEKEKERDDVLAAAFTNNVKFKAVVKFLAKVGRLLPFLFVADSDTRELPQIALFQAQLPAQTAGPCPLLLTGTNALSTLLLDIPEGLRVTVHIGAFSLFKTIGTAKSQDTAVDFFTPSATHGLFSTTSAGVFPPALLTNKRVYFLLMRIDVDKHAVPYAHVRCRNGVLKYTVVDGSG